MKPLVSLILAVYNTEPFIKRCLDSIVQQTFTDFEVIVVNDATPDHAMDIVSEYAKVDSRFSIIQKEKNEGPMAARMSGYTVAKGDYFVFCDSDDYMHPQALEVLYRKVTKEHADIAISGYKYMDEKGQIIYERIYNLPFGGSSSGVFKALLTDTIPHMVWGNIYKRQLFDDQSYSCFPNQTHGEDMILFYELVQYATKTVTTDCSLYYYCRNSMSATQKRLSLEQVEKRIFLGNYWFNYMEKLGIYPELVHKKAWKSMYFYLISGYDRHIVINGNVTLMNFFSLHELVRCMGFFRGLDLFLLCSFRCYLKFRILYSKLRRSV